jgi:acetyl esterase/lipase
MNINKIFTVLLLILLSSKGISQNKTLIYKTVNDTINLKLKIINPTTSKPQKTACAIFLSGGGWINFSWNQLNEIAYGLSDQGLTSIIVEYRTTKKHNSTPFESLQDVKDAIVFLRKNADSLKINQNQIIAIGSSAGAHLAFSSYITDEPGENKTLNSKPNYIIGISPVIRNDETGYAYERIGEKYKSFSPFYLYLNTDKRLPHSLIFSGENDPLIDFNDLKKIHEKSIEKNDKIELYSIDKVGHSMKRKYKSIYIQMYPIIIDFLKSNNIILDSFVNKVKNN